MTGYPRSGDFRFGDLTARNAGMPLTAIAETGRCSQLSVRQQNGNIRLHQHMRGGAAKYAFPHTGMRIGSQMDSSYLFSDSAGIFLHPS